MNATIYALCDPFTGHLRYIGKARDLKDRLLVHWRERTKSKKNNWIKSLWSNGVRPDVVELEEVAIAEENQSERFWIAYFKSSGASLLNMTNGGDGGAMQTEAIEKMKATKKANLTPEVSERIAAAKRGVKQSPETIAKRVEKLTGQKRTDESRELMREKATGRKHTPETLKKMSVASTGRVKTPEELAKLSASWDNGRKAHPNSLKALAENRPAEKTPEQIAKHQATMIGYKWSEEALANRKAGVQAKLAGVPRTSQAKANMSAGWALRRELGIKKKSPTPETIAKRVAKTAETKARKKAERLAAQNQNNP